jgi:hypothetical protein
MNKTILGCLVVITGCSADPGETPSQSGSFETAQQAIQLMESGDRRALADCDALAEACESEEAPDHCASVVEHCEAFRGFLTGSRDQAAGCWQGCMEADCDEEACEGLSHSHEAGRGRGLECLDALRSCDDDSCDVECGVDFNGPFSRGWHGGAAPGDESGAGFPDAGWADESGEFGAGEWTGEHPGDAAGGRLDGGEECPDEEGEWSHDDSAGSEGSWGGDAGADFGR